MLILGGRYGTVDEKFHKSYTQLEYEYALSKNIPVFAVVLNESFLTKKINSLGLSNVTEHKEPDKYQIFKTFVMSKIVKEVEDNKDIIISVHATLNEFAQNYKLSGWVRNSDETDIVQLLKDKTKLLEENNLLQNQMREYQEQLAEKSKEKLGNYSFDEIVQLFKNKIFTLPAEVARSNNPVDVNALDLYIAYHDIFIIGISDEFGTPDEVIYVFKHITPYYTSFDFLERVKLSGTTAQRIHTTKLGSASYAMLEAKNMA